MKRIEEINMQKLAATCGGDGRIETGVVNSGEDVNIIGLGAEGRSATSVNTGEEVNIIGLGAEGRKS
jgi:translation elongation factor EF-Tu-like GTPase